MYILKIISLFLANPNAVSGIDDQCSVRKNMFLMKFLGFAKYLGFCQDYLKNQINWYNFIQLLRA